jgi:transposase
MHRQGSFTVVGDMGFASAANFGMLEGLGMSYVIPLKRNTSEVCASEVSKRVNFGCVFTCNECPVLAYEPVKMGYRVLVFRDKDLRSRERSDFIVRLEKQNQVALKRGEVVVDVGRAAFEVDAFLGLLFCALIWLGLLRRCMRPISCGRLLSSILIR